MRASYTWDFGDGTQANDVNPVTHLYEFVPPTGQTVAKLILRGEDEACTFIVEKEVNIVDVIPDFIRNDGIDTVLCVGDYPFTNNSSNANIFFWDFGNGTTASGLNAVANYEEEGVYTVQLIAENASLGCIDSIQKTVVIVEPVEIIAIGDTICPGDTALLSLVNIIPGASYSWSPAELILDDPNISSPTTAPLATTTYSVTVTDDDNCTGTDTASVIVVQPLDTFSIDTIVTQGEIIQLPGPAAQGIYNYFWIPNDGLSCSDCTMPEFSAEEDITYLLIAEDPEGCFENVFTFNVDVITETLEIPNVFTPNGDGVNDRFNILSDVEIGSDFLKIKKFRVFNRWGQLIYDNETPFTGWDGRYKGKAAPSEVYVYIVVAEFPVSGKVVELSGDVTLLR